MLITGSLVGSLGGALLDEMVLAIRFAMFRRAWISGL